MKNFAVLEENYEAKLSEICDDENHPNTSFHLRKFSKSMKISIVQLFLELFPLLGVDPAENTQTVSIAYRY